MQKSLKLILLFIMILAIASESHALKMNKNSNQIELYNMVLRSAIETDWRDNKRSRSLVRLDRNLKVSIKLTVIENGTITEIIIKSSDNSELKKEALKAIVSAGPFPSLPRGYTIHKTKIIFTPKGLE